MDTTETFGQDGQLTSKEEIVQMFIIFILVIAMSVICLEVCKGACEDSPTPAPPSTEPPISHSYNTYPPSYSAQNASAESSQDV